MVQNSKIYIAGHTGMVGSAISRRLRNKGYSNVIGRSIEELDLTDQKAVANFFEAERPDCVVLAAAKVGGIMANNTYRAQFLYENLMIEANIIHQAYLNKVKKLLFLGSSCIYPRNAPQPLREEYLLTSELEQTNEPYAIAKIAGIKLCESYYRQYGCNFISVMPTNLYGPNDNYNLETSHVLPAIIRKMHLARCLETTDWAGIRADFAKRPIEGNAGATSKQEILEILKKYGITIEPGLNPDIPGPDQVSHVTLTLWGTGQVYREFMHVEDMAAACVNVIEEMNVSDLVSLQKARGSATGSHITFLNIGTGVDQTIADIACQIKSIVGFAGNISWDSSKPDGTLKKLMDVAILKDLGWNPSFSLSEGLVSVYSEYVNPKQILQ
ncbi:MAG: GDP-L-fucose synthase [Bacteroidota bacterium]